MKRYLSLLMVIVVLMAALSGCGETEEPYSPEEPLTLSNPNGEDVSFVGGGVTVDGPVVAEETELFDGIYFYEYGITDIFGQTYTSDMAMMECSHGGIMVSP